jgi:hypothetical protein
MRDSSPRVQQASTTMLCLLCSSPGASQRALHAAEAEEALLPALGGILEHAGRGSGLWDLGVLGHFLLRENPFKSRTSGLHSCVPVRLFLL